MNKRSNRKPIFRKRFFISIIVFITGTGVILATNINEATKFFSTPPSIDHKSIMKNYQKNGLLAHAFGAIDGQWYTNSKEAFSASYKKGVRHQGFMDR